MQLRIKGTNGNARSKARETKTSPSNVRDPVMDIRAWLLAAPKAIAEDMPAPLHITLSPMEWGILLQGAAKNRLTVDQAASYLLGDGLYEWDNVDCKI